MGIPVRIYDICPACHLGSYTKTIFSYAGESERVDNAGELEYEYLYSCDNCDAKLWVGEECARRCEVN